MGRLPMKAPLAYKLVCLQLPRVLCTFVCLLGVWTSGDQSSDTQTSLYGVQGGSILFQLNTSLGKMIQRVDWSLDSKKKHLPLFSLEPETGNLTLKKSLLWNRYEQRAHVTPTSLRIDNVTLEDNGNFKARILHEEVISEQSFFLSIYEPILPKIKIISKSQTSDGCNLTLECQILKISNDTTVTWGSGDIPKRQEESLGLPSNSRILNLSLPPNLHNSSVTCLAKNPAEQQNSTLKLSDACAEKSSNPQTPKSPWFIGSFLLVILLGILGIGLWICRRKEKKKEVMDSPENQRNSDMNILYAMLRPSRPEDQNQCQEASEQHLQEGKHLTTIYSEIHNPQIMLR
ncbi:CD48 antigen-like [Monodelphis domestica]|uniref:CD48 antigen-like n=1 Tax=Monodelphis domestica TaxID=13616 RepID=UPI0024E1D7BE|nr:CD48 antigen-like [Monodelphis domestica]